MRTSPSFKGRKLRTEILIVFLFLIALSSTTIIAFTYFRNNKLISRMAEETIDRVNLLIANKITCMLNDLALLPKLGGEHSKRVPDEKVPSDAMLAFLLAGLQAHPDLYAYYVGTPLGNAIVAFNLALTDKPYYFSDSADPPPPKSAYAAILIDRGQTPPMETWVYFDASLKTIASQKVAFRQYDPRTRPWYMGAKETGNLFLTDVFLFDPTSDSGIAWSLPVYDQTGKLICIYGADLSLRLFCEFLQHQKIGKEGHSFILDASGKILIPQDPKILKSIEPIAERAFARYQIDKTKDFTFKYNKKKYLAAMSPFPPRYKKNWLILVIDPFDDFFSKAIKTEHQVVLISLAILLVAAYLVIFFARHISAPIVVLANEVDKITHLELESNRRVVSDIEEINVMDHSIADLRNAIRSFSRYAPREVVKGLITQGKDIALGGEKREITILFTDINDFTPVVETKPIDEVISLLAEYFDLLSKIILENQGTIDKYLGDGIMAFWGAPIEMSDQATRACLSALLCQSQLARLNQQREQKNLPPFYTRIGINAGNVLVGNIGTTERMNYTVIGDAVNAAARIQNLNKAYHTQILISEEVQSKLHDAFLTRPIDTVEVKGKKRKIKLYELMAKKEGIAAIGPTTDQLELCALFTQAYNLYEQGRKIEAVKEFAAIQRKFPSDYPTGLYMEKLSMNDK